MPPSPPPLEHVNRRTGDLARTQDQSLEATTLRKVSRRLLPFMFLLYVFNILDRLNVNAAALTMPHDLHFTNAQYGFGVGMFFWGYLIFEVPSNLILEKVGARKWIARIMLSWGVVASAMMFSWNIASFATFRFLLGLTEAG